jgi:uncharacterized membrane protein
VGAKKKSLAKTITWRITASFTTFIIAWAYTGELDAGILIGSSEAVVKMFLYYGHDRAWDKLLTREVKGLSGAPRRQAAAKTITWRIIASTTTFVIAFIVTGELVKSLEIGLTEAAAKMLLYYYHERIWEQYYKNKTLNKEASA